MDAEHRHELKSNELAAGLQKLPALIKENSNVIIGTALIAIGLITWPILNKMNRQKDITEQAQMTQAIQLLDQDIYAVMRAQQAEGGSDAEALNTLRVNAEALLDKAADVDNPNLQALAHIKAAQAIRTGLHLSKDVTPQMLEEQIARAKAGYEKATEVADTSAVKAMAQFGLGLCAEELGQTAQAADIYKGILAEKETESTGIYQLAQQRLNALDENSEPFTFVETPKPLVPLQMPENLTVTEITPAAEPAAEQETPAQPSEETPQVPTE